MFWTLLQPCVAALLGQGPLQMASDMVLVHPFEGATMDDSSPLHLPLSRLSLFPSCTQIDIFHSVCV